MAGSIDNVGFGSFKFKAILLATVSISLFGAIIFSGINLVNHLQAQDELLTSGISRSERGLNQLAREVLRLNILVRASHQEFDSELVQQQINLIYSRLGIIQKHHISSDLPPELAAKLVLFDQEWQQIEQDLGLWLATPENRSTQLRLHTKLVNFEKLINDLSSRHTNQRREQYVRLVVLRSSTIRLIAIISVLFLIFICFAIINTAQFIRERQRILTTIREKETQYRRIIETAEEGIWLLDTQGKTTFANQKMADLLGLDETSFQKASLWNFLPSHRDVASAKTYLSNITKGSRTSYDIQLVRPDGEIVWMLTNGTPIFNDVGEHTGTLCMLTDVTDRKQYEEELKIAKQKAEVANQAKSKFLANMSHELRTPLNGILGYAQILERSANLTTEESKGIQIIYQCGAHLLTLINDVLDLSKIEADRLELNPTALNLPSLLQSVVNICRIRAEQKGIEFIYQPSPNLPTGVIVDEKRLRQVLINLLSNAIKFTKKGAVSLDIQARYQVKDLVSLQFQITDTGVGINQKDLSRLFQAFEQVGDRRKQAEGTGLGLAISQRIVRLMDSTIQVESVVEKGSTFSFTINVPLTPTSNESQSNLANQEYIVGYSGRHRRILVIDDRWENRAVLRNLLEPLGFTVAEAEHGQAGLKQLQLQRPDMVITDLVMPGMDGVELLRHIRASTELKGIKVVVSSASVSQKYQDQVMYEGGNGFLIKPIDANQLFELLSTQLKLEWLYKAQPETSLLSTELIVPPRRILTELFELAQQANLKSLKFQIHQLVNSDRRYQPFANLILQLAKQFQIEEIEELLQEHLAQTLPTHV